MYKFIILTEASEKIGHGHLMRCSALYYEFLKYAPTVYYVNASESTKTDSYMIKADWNNTDFIKSNITEDDYVIVDSYQTDDNFCTVLSSIAHKVVYIDDFNRINYAKGIIIHPSLREKYTIIDEVNKKVTYAGKDYVILRDAFRTSAIYTKRNTEIQKILITLGGTDVHQLSAKLIEWLHEFNGTYQIKVITSKKNSSLFNNVNHTNVDLMFDLSANEMLSEFLKNDLIISGCGQTIYELLCLGTTFFPIQLVDNQTTNCKDLIDGRYFPSVARFDDPDLKEKLEDFIRNPLYQNAVPNLKNGVNNIVNIIMKSSKEIV